MRDVASVRQKIIDKLNKRKLQKPKKDKKEDNKILEVSLAGKDELELFSRDGLTPNTEEKQKE